MWNWVERYRIEYNVVGAATVSEEKEVFKEKKRKEVVIIYEHLLRTNAKINVSYFAVK